MGRKSENMTGFKTEIQYSEDNENIVEYLNYDIETPHERAELNTAYGFFETEAEAAQSFLDEIKEHPEARYSDLAYQAALKAVAK